MVIQSQIQRTPQMSVYESGNIGELDFKVFDLVYLSMDLLDE